MPRTNFCTTGRVSLSNGGYPKVGKPPYLLGLTTLENPGIPEVNIISMGQKLSNVLLKPDESS